MPAALNGILGSNCQSPDIAMLPKDIGEGSSGGTANPHHMILLQHGAACVT